MAEYKYNKQLQFVKSNSKGNLVNEKSEYTNGEGMDSRFSLWDIIKWKFSKEDFRKGRKDKDYSLNVIMNSAFLNSKEDMIVWLGHATFYIQINGIRIITDPIFAAMPFVPRKADLPLDSNLLTGIDYILLSHGHRDHFDKKSMSILKKNNPNIEVLLPMDLGKWFTKKGIKNEAAAWFQQYDTVGDIEIIFLPALHWNRRDGNDFNKALWGSFLIKSKNKTIYFAGDTAYGKHFKEIGELYPDIDYCLLPIAAYHPQYIMKQSHMSPWEAITAFADIKGKTMIPMHYGTFQLADEYLGEPEEVMKKSIPEININILAPGESLEI